VDLVGEHYDAADPAAHRAGGHLNRGQDVGRAVMACQGRVAHGPGDRDRSLAIVGQVEQEGGLLDGVGSLRDYRPSGAGADEPAAQPGQLDDISDLQRRAGNQPHIMDLEIGSGLRETGHRR